MWTRILMVAAAASLALGGAMAAQAPQDPPAEAQGYAWDGACKDCHSAIHDAWSKTKHARSIDRLDSTQRQGGECIGCHVTGPKGPIRDEAGDMVNANIQCESCHGPGKAHAEAAAAGNPIPAGMTRKPPESLCKTCHNEKSPHYRGFYFQALVNLVHKH